MSSSSNSAIAASDPLPPDDALTRPQVQADLEIIYRRRASALINHFSGASRDCDVAADVVHEAFARFAALSSARRLLIARPESYLFRICLNLFRERQRSGMHRAMHEQTAESSGPWHDPVVELENRDRLRRLEAAIERLKPKHVKSFSPGALMA